MTLNPNLLDDLEARGLIHDTTDKAALAERLAEGPIGVYDGFDPTAKSLHVGNLMGLLLLRRFQLAGHRAIALAGGSTGMIGDPGGKSAERNLLDADTLTENLEAIKGQLSRFLDFEGGNPAILVNNYDWTKDVSALEFMRDVGKHITVNQMVAKDSVKSRMSSETGISYTEFSYMLLQAYDFWWLSENENCEMQIGGSDQWGNISLGVELIRKKSQKKAFALTTPLLTKADGSKYGKTAGGETLWLDPEMMSPYRFYQAWMQTPDEDVEKLLLQFTLLELDVIAEVMSEHNADPAARVGQKRIAQELTTLVHGAEATGRAQSVSGVLFGKTDVGSLDEETLQALAAEVPTAQLSNSLLADDDNCSVILSNAEVVASKSEAARLIKQNGVAVNGAKLVAGQAISKDDLQHGKYVVVHKGKKAVHVLEFV